MFLRADTGASPAFDLSPSDFWRVAFIMDNLTFDFNKREKIYTVLELNDTVRGIIRERFPSYVWVCGEIQDLRERQHVNLNLVQKDEKSDKLIAQVRAVIFANVKFSLYKKLKTAGVELKDDIEVKLLCKVDLYSKNGAFSLTVFDADPSYTLGKAAQNRQQILEDLKKRGLLAKNKLLSLPLVPLRLGLITSAASAAFFDFTSELKNSGFAFKVFLRDCHMQGKNVEADVTGALRIFQSMSDKLDAVVITRGGGSTADLGWFDNKLIAETIAGLSLPVVSGLGHEINTTITDIVAHTFQKTPTKVAQFLVEKVADFEKRLDEFSSEICNAAEEVIAGYKQSLQSSAFKIEAMTLSYFRDHFLDLSQKKQQCLHLASSLTEKSKQFLVQAQTLLTLHSKNILSQAENELESIKDKMKMLDPKNVMKRGFSLTLKQGKAVKDAALLQPGDKITTVFYKGEAESTIDKTSA